METWATASIRTASVAVCAALFGCSGPYVDRGSTLYEHGRYIEAAEVFERTEYRLPESSEWEHAQYGLYRGLTFVKLGDYERARQWLAYAHQIESRHPGTLRASDIDALGQAWALVESRFSPPGDVRAIVSARPEPTALGGNQDSNGRRSMRDAESLVADEL